MRRFISLFFLFAIASTFLVAQEENVSALEFERELGDQALSLNLGVLIPLFSQESVGAPLLDMKLSEGGWFSITWDIYFTEVLRGGFELSGAFALSEIGSPAYMFNFLIRFSYVPRIRSFDIPITLAFGLNGSGFEENSKGDFMLKTGIGLYWNINSVWSIGADAHYIFIPQIYTGPSPPAEDSRLVSLLDVSISVRYHF